MTIIWLIGGILFVCFGLIVFRGAPYVPTHRREVERAFDELCPLSDQDVVVDLGSGDGLVVRAAARRGARAIGYELNPLLAGLARWLSRGSERVEIRLADMWLTPLPDDTTVVYAFAVSRDFAKLGRLLQRHVERTGRPLVFIGYGSHLVDREPDATLGAHSLFRLAPLHQK